MIHKINQHIVSFFILLLSISIVTKIHNICSLPPEIHDNNVQEFINQKNLSLVTTQTNNLLQKKTIFIKNGITQDMLVYKHWTGQYSPDSFSIEINGKELEQGKEEKFILENDTIDIIYKFSFPHGFYKGTRTCQVAIGQEKHFCLVFDWNKNPRIQLETH